MTWKSTLKDWLCGLYFRLLQLLPKKKKVVFLSYYGKQYSDNPRFISEALMKRDKSIDIVWLLQNNQMLPGTARRVNKHSLRSFYELATAKVWVNNARMPIWVKKRKSQYYIQTWHGGVCLKAVEKDAEEQLPAFYIARCKNDSKMADLFLSECEWRTQNYRNAFWYEGEVLKCGIPRSDIFYLPPNEIKKKVNEFYSFSSDERIVLYAPTFRSDYDMSVYNIDTLSILNSISTRFGGDWVLLIRLHPNMIQKQDEITYSSSVFNGSLYPEMNELLMACDILITDYSGCMFDAMRIGKKVFIFAPDLEHYINSERRLYFDIKQLPAPFADSPESLITNIENFDVQTYEERISKFLKGMGYYGNGQATDAVVERIINTIYKRDMTYGKEV